MSHLSKLQYQFQTRVLDPRAAGTPLWVSAGGRADPVTQVTVYSHAYRARLQEVLTKDFPAVHMAIGDDDFYQLADAYIQAHPSKHFSLREFAQHLPEFIRQHAYHQERPWLTELACFEWTLCSAFDAADAPQLTEQSMAAIAPEHWPQLRFVAHPSLRLVNFAWNIPEMWKVLISDTPGEIHAIPDEQSYWLIWRDNLITRYRSLPVDEQHALNCLCTGENFDDICARLVEFNAAEHVPLRAATLLKTWIGQGLISGIIT
jgi:hypothetical protein